MTRLSRVRGLGRAIAVVVGITGAGSLASGLLQPGIADSATDFLEGRSTESEFRDAIGAFTAVSLLTSVALLAGAVLVMIWMYRMAANIRAFDVSTTWHPLFAVFGWFLPPFALYIIPFLMLRELWRKSAPSASAGNALVSSHSPSQSNENPLLWVWFVIFGLLPALLFVIQADSFFDGFTATDMEAAAESLQDSSTTGLISSLGTAVAAVVWIMFVRQQTARHSSMTNEN